MNFVIGARPSREERCFLVEGKPGDTFTQRVQLSVLERRPGVQGLWLSSVSWGVVQVHGILEWFVLCKSGSLLLQKREEQLHSVLPSQRLLQTPPVPWGSLPEGGGARSLWENTESGGCDGVLLGCWLDFHFIRGTKPGRA